jgi:hypothetical protein
MGVPRLRIMDRWSGERWPSPRPRGTLDDTSWLRPTRHIWVRSKAAVGSLRRGEETFETAPQARDGASSDLLNLQRSRRERLKQFSLIACLLQPCRPVRTILDHHLAIVDRRNVLAG